MVRFGSVWYGMDSKEGMVWFGSVWSGMDSKVRGKKVADFTPEQKKEIKEYYNNECQLSKLFGIAEQTGVQCSRRKHIHHVRYKEAQDVTDGILMCERCHDYITELIRREKYRNGKHDINEMLKKSVRKDPVCKSNALCGDIKCLKI